MSNTNLASNVIMIPANPEFAKASAVRARAPAWSRFFQLDKPSPPFIRSCDQYGACGGVLCIF